MLNDDSVPVWMLADSLLGLLVLGVIGGVTLLPMAAVQPGGTSKVISELRAARQTAEAAVRSAQADVRRLMSVEETQTQEVTRLRQLSLEWETYAGAMKQQMETEKTARSAKEQELATLQKSMTSEQSVRQELLGLKGSLDRTVFVIDISGSMTNEFSGDYVRANWRTGDTAWINVQRQIGHYLELLPVESFRIVCFNHDLYEFPLESGVWSTDRTAAIKFLAGLTPTGLTGTENAVRKAAEYRPSSILLFTDGQPTRAVVVKSASGTEKPSSEADPAQQEQILEMAKTGAIGCPVNVIALNDYAFQPSVTAGSSSDDRSLLQFLQELAGRSGGAFLGY